VQISYSPWLVATSLAVAILASYVALNLVSNVAIGRRRGASLLWLAGSAVAMGTGIWSMHFIGMLAASIGIPMAYHLGWTALSLLIAVLVSGFALHMVSSDTMPHGKLVVCGAVMGAGIAGMHYVGMGALEISPGVRYDPVLFIASVLIAMAASYVALSLFVKLRSQGIRNPLLKRGGSAVIMGLAIVGMHYTGMAAANFAPDSVCTAPSPDGSNPWLALSIAGFTAMMLGTALLGSMFDTHLTRRAREHESSLEEMNRLLRKEKQELAQANAQLRSEIAERAAAELARQRADAANDAKSTFLATMSHEIRTPMNGLLGLLEMLSLTQLDASQRSALRGARESGKSLLRIIDDILDFSKIEAQKLDILPEPTCVRQLMEGIRDAFSGSASSKGLLLSCRVDPRLSPVLMVDAVRLRQILGNLVSNAIKFTHRGEVSITADLMERATGRDHLRFYVRDTGIGISPEDQRKLFTPYTQADLGTARRYGGTGLGLAISRRLAELMGGTIDLVSDPGQGTTLILDLTLGIADPSLLQQAAGPVGESQPALGAVPMPQPQPDPAPAQAPAPAPGVPLVLVADDHPTNRLLLASQVQALGYGAESAANGHDALALWESGRFSLVLTDCNMPVMSGYELARAIRSRESARGAARCPIVACTANAMNDEAAQWLDAGIDAYLVKPLDLATLVTELTRWLPMPEAPEPTAA
jgi:signal transduction histidine kinase/ActR/RegA family two-component response regulator